MDKKSSDSKKDFLICDKCKCYYPLQPDESPDDFSDECKCGGHIKHVINVNDHLIKSKSFDKDLVDKNMNNNVVEDLKSFIGSHKKRNFAIFALVLLIIIIPIYSIQSLHNNDTLLSNYTFDLPDNVPVPGMMVYKDIIVPIPPGSTKIKIKYNLSGGAYGKMYIKSYNTTIYGDHPDIAFQKNVRNFKEVDLIKKSGTGTIELNNPEIQSILIEVGSVKGNVSIYYS